MATTIVEKTNDKKFSVTIGTSQLEVTVKSGGDVVTLGQVAQAALSAAKANGLEDADRYVIASKAKDGSDALMYANQVYVVSDGGAVASFDPETEVREGSDVIFTEPQRNA